jgi:hypothetical protein
MYHLGMRREPSWVEPRVSVVFANDSGRASQADGFASIKTSDRLLRKFPIIKSVSAKHVRRLIEFRKFLYFKKGLLLIRLEKMVKI